MSKPFLPTTVSPKCACRIGGVCQNAGCAYFGERIPAGPMDGACEGVRDRWHRTTAEIVDFTEIQRARIRRKVMDWMIPVIIDQAERERLADRAVEWLLS